MWKCDDLTSPFPLTLTVSIAMLTKLALLFSLGMADLLRLLLQVAEKAANVARVCRQEAPLFQLLVQEKTGDDKNKKFVQDFKTLADVVIQEMIRHDVGAQVRERDGGEVTPDWWRSVIFALLVFSSRRWSASSTERSPTSLKMGLVIVQSCILVSASVLFENCQSCKTGGKLFITRDATRLVC